MNTGLRQATFPPLRTDRAKRRVPAAGRGGGRRAPTSLPGSATVIDLEEEDEEEDSVFGNGNGGAKTGTNGVAKRKLGNSASNAPALPTTTGTRTSAKRSRRQTTHEQFVLGGGGGGGGGSGGCNKQLIDSDSDNDDEDFVDSDDAEGVHGNSNHRLTTSRSKGKQKGGGGGKGRRTSKGVGRPKSTYHAAGILAQAGRDGVQAPNPRSPDVTAQVRCAMAAG